MNNQSSGQSAVEGATPGERWDLFVVGGGTAGLVAAKTAARLGARVLLAERDRTGGDCLWTGCVPSKALLAAAAVAATARRGARMGVEVGSIAVDFARVMTHVRGAIEAIEPEDSVESLHAVGVTVHHGHARFTGPATAEIRAPDGARREVAFRQAVLAAGAAPAVPPIPGLTEVDPLTSDTIWDLSALPGRLAVLGGGSVGCELGQAFARLGAQTVLVEAADTLLPREDPHACAALRSALLAEGVEVRTGQPVESVRPDAEVPGAGVLLLADGTEVAFDRLLVALGRTPRTADLGLAAAGVRLDARGFAVVDGLLRTTNRRIWAAGDLTGHPQFTHVAGVHASVVAGNAVLGLRRTAQTRTLPRVTYTDPEIAAVGLSADDPDAHRVLTMPHGRVDRAVVEGATDGASRLVLDSRGRIVGASVVGPRAGETLGELCVAVQRRMRPRDLAAVVHAYPTWNDGPWKTAVQDVRASLEGPVAARVIGLAASARRRWLDLRR